MSLNRNAREKLVRALAVAVIEHADELTSLDQAIGDGDHGLNMKRGFMELGKALPEEPVRADLVAATDKAIAAVKARGRSEAGQKTLLDVLVPVQMIFAAGGDAAAIAAEAAEAAERTTPMLAIRGRASFLGERSIGHMDPGSRSVSLLISAAAATLEFEAGL